MRLLSLFHRHRKTPMTAHAEPLLAESQFKIIRKYGPVSEHYADRGTQQIDDVPATPMRFDGRKLLPASFFDAVAAARARQNAIMASRKRLLKGDTLKQSQELAERALGEYGLKLAAGQPAGDRPMSSGEIEATWHGFESQFCVNGRLLALEAAKASAHLAGVLDELSNRCAAACKEIAEEAGVRLESAELGFAPTLKANADFWRLRVKQWNEDLADPTKPPPPLASVDQALARFELQQFFPS